MSISCHRQKKRRESTCEKSDQTSFARRIKASSSRLWNSSWYLSDGDQASKTPAWVQLRERADKSACRRPQSPSANDVIPLPEWLKTTRPCSWILGNLSQRYLPDEGSGNPRRGFYSRTGTRIWVTWNGSFVGVVADPGIPLSDFSHDPTLLPFFPKLFRICSGSPDKPWIASGRDVGGSKAS